MRCNNYYFEFLKRYLKIEFDELDLYSVELPKEKLGNNLISAIKSCKGCKDWIKTDEKRSENSASATSFVKAISENPNTGAVAIVMLVLMMM